MGAQVDQKRALTHPLDWAIIEWAEEHHGVAGTEELRVLGLGARETSRREASGRLHEVWPDAFSVGLPSMTKLGRYRAAILTCGGGAVISHRSAAALWGIRLDNRRWVDVTFTHGRRTRERQAIHIHRTRHLTAADVTEVYGIPVTSLARTLCDLAAVSRPNELDKAVDSADRLELFDLAAIDALLARAPRLPGTGNLKRVLAGYAPPHTKSELEERHRRMLLAHRLPLPDFNVLLTGESGQTQEVDNHYPLDRVVVQLDGWEHHRTRRDRQRDAEKDLDLELAGERVLRLIWHDVVTNHGRTARRLSRLIPSSIRAVKRA